MFNNSRNGRILLGCAVLLLCVAGSVPASAQVSGFMSTSYGYHRNPLYNYEMIPDQLRENYLELQYAHPLGNGTIAAGYVGGLMLFNTFTDRNYYEHNGRIVLQQVYGSVSSPPRIVQPGSEDEAEEEEHEGGEPVDRDSVRSYLDVTAQFGGRHDKPAFREFDNFGASMSASYRFRIGTMFMRVHNDVGIRSYVNLTELSNITEVMTVRLGWFSPDGLTFGVLAQGGFKHYPKSVDDTSLISVAGNQGKGKGGANPVVQAENGILVTASTTTSSQLSGGVFAGSSWSAGSLIAELRYRHNLGSETRYLAQYANTSKLDEDIYNEFFSYDGPSSCIVFRQTLPLGLQSIVTINVMRKRFSGPALNLVGDVTANNRIDLHSSAEFWLSRYFELFNGLGLDIALSAEAVRNQSNDDYNDFSLSHVGMSVGVGF